MRTETTILTILLLTVAVSLFLSMTPLQAQVVSVTVTWQLSINVTGDATGTILPIDNTFYSQYPVSRGLLLTAEDGSTGHRVVATTRVAAGSTKQYVFSTWTSPPPGLLASNPNGTFTWPSKSSAEIANYTTQYGQTLCYTVSGGGTPLAPSFTANQLGSPFSQTLTTSATTYYFDSGSDWVETDPLTGSGNSERWQSNQTLIGTISGALTLNITYYHQLQQTLSYSVAGGGSPTAPTFTANQFGSSTSATLTSKASGTWFDANASWTVTNPLGGSTNSERWFYLHANGRILGAQTLVFSYSHQYYLAIQVNPSNSGNTSPSGFFDYGGEIQISATANPGYAFKNWTGSGAGSFTGTLNSALVTLNEAVTETAFFTSQSEVSITVTSSPTGSGFLIVDGTSIVSPYTYSWTPGTTHTIAASSPVGGAAAIRYIWQSWSDGGAESHTITVPSSSNTFTANFQQQYQLTITATTGGTTIPAPSSYWYDSGQSVSVAAAANSGYDFSNWSLDGGNAGLTNPLTVTMSSSHTLVGNFEQVPFITTATVVQIIEVASSLLAIGAVVYGVYRAVKSRRRKSLRKYLEAGRAKH